ncbi:MAG: hypothetical protein U5Q44_01235 [Dehalococcoidia bacterium]|nr:hypothetical protein [Dehalococcoidia bacterium]
MLVHGPLQGAWLCQYITDWAGPAGRVRNLSWQNRGRAFPERDLTFKGRVTAVEGNEVSLEAWEEDDEGNVLVPATARVWLPGRG